MSLFKSKKFWKELNEWSKTIFAFIGLYIVFRKIAFYLIRLIFPQL